MHFINEIITQPLYLNLFLDSLFSAMFLPVRAEFMIHAMLASGQYPVFMVIWVAFLGSLIGIIWNYLVFYLIMKLVFSFKLLSSDLELKRYTQGHYGLKRYFLWVAFFAGWWIPGTFISALMGFFKTPLWWFIPLAGLGKLAHYAYLFLL